MTKTQYTRISWSIYFFTFSTLILLAWITFKAASATENWSYFQLDFKEKHTIISSYGTLLAAALSFISILFVLMDLMYQKRLKHEEIENKEIEAKKKLKDNLEITKLFLEHLTTNCTLQSVEFSKFIVSENQNPTQMNLISFYPNTFPKLILNVDKKAIFEALNLFKPSEDWKKLYVKLYQLVDFYDKSYAELSEKNKIHYSNKYKLSKNISELVDEFIDEVSKKRNQIIEDKETDKSKPNPYFDLLDFVQTKAIEVTEKRKNMDNSELLENGDPASMTIWRKDILQPFFDASLSLRNSFGSDNYKFEVLLNLAQALIRKIDILTTDSVNYVENIEQYNNSYYIEDSENIKKLKEIITQLGDIE
ncbi:hypothetical protein [Flavicella sp.]|uniref:hypothetical protein n=1 Tax=Flavicella sp. TaxID=2957742 RepID=UPI0030192061